MQLLARLQARFAAISGVQGEQQTLEAISAFAIQRHARARTWQNVKLPAMLTAGALVQGGGVSITVAVTGCGAVAAGGAAAVIFPVALIIAVLARMVCTWRASKNQLESDEAVNLGLGLNSELEQQLAEFRSAAGLYVLAQVALRQKLIALLRAEARGRAGAAAQRQALYNDLQRFVQLHAQ